jgi:hypothetical protein
MGNDDLCGVFLLQRGNRNGRRETLSMHDMTNGTNVQTKHNGRLGLTPFENFDAPQNVAGLVVNAGEMVFGRHGRHGRNPYFDGKKDFRA